MQENKFKNKNKTRLSSFKKCIYLWEEGMNTLNFYSNGKKLLRCGLPMCEHTCIGSLLEKGSACPLCPWLIANRWRGSSGRLTSGKGYPVRAQCSSVCLARDQTWSPCERVQVGELTLGDSHVHLHKCAALCVSMTTQNGGRSLDVLLAPCCFHCGSRQA